MKYSKTMMMLFSVLGFFISTAYADTVQEYYCAKNYQTVKLGDNILQVKGACGEPQEEKAGTEVVEKQAPLTQWFYQVNNVALNGTAYITNVFTFKEGKVVKIQVQGQEVSSTSICDTNVSINNATLSTSMGGTNVNNTGDGSPVSIGDTEDTVSSACGDPTFINQATTVESRKTEDTVIWTYSNPTTGSSVTFQFNKGILISISPEG
ncbi:MAG: DUF2845 domain-containing protein [Proteobacteria bacterium]|nr:DUF2845 domain-containing protein [Pseudomonadota bacterium]